MAGFNAIFLEESTPHPRTSCQTPGGTVVIDCPLSKFTSTSYHLRFFNRYSEQYFELAAL